MYIPNLGEVSIFIAAMIGACIGFLWYNTFPAQVFMGDTGSLALGGIIASLAIIIRKELLIPCLLSTPDASHDLTRFILRWSGILSEHKNNHNHSTLHSSI